MKVGFLQLSVIASLPHDLQLLSAEQKLDCVKGGCIYCPLCHYLFKPLQPPFLPAQLTCPNSLLKQDLPLTEVQAHQENGKFYALLLILHNLHYYHQIEQENKCWHILAKQPLKIETSSHKR